MVQLLVQERLSAALTQRDLAERLKKPRSYVSKIEVCERRIDVMELIHYLRALKKIRANLSNWRLQSSSVQSWQQKCGSGSPQRPAIL